MPTAALLVSCPDQRGLVARLSDFIFRHGGNIIHADQHTDAGAGLFLTRLEWDMEGFDLAREAVGPAFARLAAEIRAQWSLHFSDVLPRMAVWCSKQDHCLLELLWRQRAGDLRAEIPLIVSNHEELEPLARQFGIEFLRFPVTPANKPEMEKGELAAMALRRIDLVVLAKYMQILSPEFIAAFPNVINIHHSFLPAFAGGHPYAQAYERGVKIIGATAHFVTGELDAGPIIEQDVIRISHRDSVADLARKGKDVERLVLARAVRLHLENRVLVYNNRTVVFA